MHSNALTIKLYLVLAKSELKQTQIFNYVGAQPLVSKQNNFETKTKSNWRKVQMLC